MVTGDSRSDAVDDAVPPGRLGPWLAGQVPGAAGPVRVEKLSGGSSNLTFRVRERDWHEG